MCANRFSLTRFCIRQLVITQQIYQFTQAQSATQAVLFLCRGFYGTSSFRAKYIVC